MIPFEYQIRRVGQRCCGAAALCMVLRSFEIDAGQECLWSRLQSFAPGLNRARTFDLARLALEQGLSALPVRLKKPWATLEILDFLQDNEIRIVLNHRIRENSFQGHFSVFVGLDRSDEAVLLHDPQFGPNRRLSKNELLRLWTPLEINAESGNKTGNEITGNVAVLFSKRLGREKICPKCKGVYFIEPFQPLKESNSSFAAIFCPFCDYKQ